MQPLFLRFYYCVLYVQHPHLGYWHCCSPFPNRTVTANHWQEQALAQISVCILLRVQIKMHQQRLQEQANKITRVPQTPTGIFSQGGRETTGKSQGWSSEGPGGKKVTRLPELQAVLTWEQVLWSHRHPHLGPLKEDDMERLPTLAFFKALCAKLPSPVSWLHW